MTVKEGTMPRSNDARLMDLVDSYREELQAGRQPDRETILHSTDEALRPELKELLELVWMLQKWAQGRARLPNRASELVQLVRDQYTYSFVSWKATLSPKAYNDHVELIVRAFAARRRQIARSRQRVIALDDGVGTGQWAAPTADKEPALAEQVAPEDWSPSVD
jgi:hypothetical protein